MTWYLQTPEPAAPKLLDALNGAADGASEFGGAYAFATSSGVQLFLGQPAIKGLAKAGAMTLVVGTDAITDTAAIEMLKRHANLYPNLTVRAFLNPGKGTFHPKVAWFDHNDGGVVVTGSGNLTSGGLYNNWEAFDVEALGPAQLADVKADWAAWLDAHAEQLRQLDDPQVAARVTANKVNKVQIAAALGGPVQHVAEADLELAAQIPDAAPQKTVLIAEIPKAGDRWAQANLSQEVFRGYFGVEKGEKKKVTFFPLNDSGILGEAEERTSGERKSNNYGFEISAAKGIAYPEGGPPIVIYDRLGEDMYRYKMLLPGQSGYTEIRTHLDAKHTERPDRMRRPTIGREELDAAWPGNPFS